MSDTLFKMVTNRKFGISDIISNTRYTYYVGFNKGNSYLDIKYDRVNNLNFKITRNLDNCKFANTYLSLSMINNITSDFSNVYMGINEDKRKLVLYNTEKYIIEEYNGKPINYILMFKFRISEIINSLCYYLFQRRLYDYSTEKNIIRTFSLQISDKTGTEFINKL